MAIVTFRCRARVSYFEPGRTYTDVTLTEKIAPLIDKGLLELLEIDGTPTPRPPAEGE